MTHCWPTTEYCQSDFVNNAESSGTLRDVPPAVIENALRREAASAVLIEGGVREGSKYYCLRSVLRPTECLNANVLDCSVTFSVDKNIYILGVQVPTQMTELVS